MEIVFLFCAKKKYTKKKLGFAEKSPTRDVMHKISTK